MKRLTIEYPLVLKLDQNYVNRFIRLYVEATELVEPKTKQNELKKLQDPDIRSTIDIEFPKIFMICNREMSYINNLLQVFDPKVEIIDVIKLKEGLMDKTVKNHWNTIRHAMLSLIEGYNSKNYNCYWWNNR